MPRLSVIMIVRDEAHCLADCLGSVRPIADEIVVVDTGSSDDTRAIADRFGARVFSFDWIDDFAAARNASIAQATGEWLLHMDADEMLDPQGAAQVRALVDADGAGADAVELILLNYCNDPRAWRWRPAPGDDPWTRGFSGYLPVPLLRLFRSSRGFAYREPVHENITESVIERGGRIHQSDIVIHHYGYTLPGQRGKEKAQRYLAIARTKAAAYPQDVKSLHDLAEQAIACGEVEEAEQACRKILALSPAHMPAATSLANVLLLEGNLAQARAVLEGLETHIAPPPHVHTALGAIALHEGDLAAAEERLHVALRQDPQQLIAWLYLARVHDIQGEPDAARAALEDARQIAPNLDETKARLAARSGREQGEEAFSRGELDLALKLFVEALQLDAEDPLLHNNIGVVLHAMGQSAKAAQSFSRALRLMPGLAEARENLRQLGA